MKEKGVTINLSHVMSQANKELPDLMIFERTLRKAYKFFQRNRLQESLVHYLEAQKLLAALGDLPIWVIQYSSEPIAIQKYLDEKIWKLEGNLYENLPRDSVQLFVAAQSKPATNSNPDRLKLGSAQIALGNAHLEVVQQEIEATQKSRVIRFEKFIRHFGSAKYWFYEAERNNHRQAYDALFRANLLCLQYYLQMQIIKPSTPALIALHEKKSLESAFMSATSYLMRASMVSRFRETSQFVDGKYFEILKSKYGYATDGAEATQWLLENAHLGTSARTLVDLGRAFGLI
jgi:hypothetical protein